MTLKQCIVFLVACLLGTAGFAFDPEKDVKVGFRNGAVILTTPAGTHLKKSFTEVTLASKPGKVTAGPLPAASAKDELGEDVYHGSVHIPVTGDGLLGEVVLEVQYQPCTEGEGGNCFPPTSRMLKVKASEIPAAKGEKKAETQNSVRSATSAEINAPASVPEIPVAAHAPVSKVAPMEVTASAGLQQSLLLTLLLVFLAGMGASLTPCVYPMIPITMAIIGAKGGGKAKGFLLSLVLVLGMAVTYTVLGVVAAKSGAAFGAFAQKPAFLIPVSVLFSAFALSLFGAFEINLPQGLQNRLQGNGPRQGYLGAFVMGLVLGPLAAPCVGPIIGAVLVGIAQQGDVFLGALKLFIFSLGMGVLFMLAGTFSASLPRSGNWLTRFKYIMGLVVLAFAVWNVRLIVPEALNCAMWSLTLMVGAGVFGIFEDAEGLVPQLRRGFAILLLILGLLLGIKAVECHLDMQLLPRGVGTTTGEVSSKTWMEQDLEGALKKAKAEHKLVLVDIYAEWCAQCKELDEKTWPDTNVKAWIEKNAVAIRIDTDKQRPDLAKKLEVRSYPSVILLDSDGKEVSRNLGFHKPQAMLDFLTSSK